MPVSPWNLIAFPKYARQDLAYQEEIIRPDFPPSLVDVFPLTGGFLWIVVSLTCRVICDATVLTRNIVLMAKDENLRDLYRIPQVQTMAASSTTFFTWNAATSTSYGVTNNGIAPVAPLLLFPNNQLQLQVNNFGFNDTLDVIRYVMVKIPTGPEYIQSNAPADSLIPNALLEAGKVAA